jgi:phosphate transport system substrate-binding protein
MSKSMLIVALGAGTLTLAACGGGSADSRGVSGNIRIDGSSTVFPVAEALAEEFQIANPNARVTVGFSGTGGGFQRFCSGETDLTNASRPITADEREACAAAGIGFSQLRVGWDGMSIIVNPANEFVTCLTVPELRRIWEPGSSVDTWRDVRAEWPAEQIRLYGPGTDSGTFDFFTETINGESGASRPDFQASEDDNILVQGVAGDRFALGYFGYAYFVENQGRLKLVAVDGGEGCVLPSAETIESGTYTPLARPLYMYLSLTALERPEVLAFAEYMLEEAESIVPSTGYHALSPAEYEEQLRAIREASGGAS